MFYIRCLLPAFPVGVIAGAITTVNLAMRYPVSPSSALILGAGMAIAATWAVSRYLHQWSDRARRRLGYTAASLVGLGTTAAGLFVTLMMGLCNTWGETCTAEENAGMTKTAILSLLAPFAIVGLYSVADTVSLHRADLTRRDAARAADDPPANPG